MLNPAAANLIDTLGAKRIAERVNVGQPSVSMAKRGMPVRWYPAIRELCEAEQIECPEAAFNWDRKKAGTA